MDSTLYVVHCIDTEGPLTETLADSFNRIEKIYNLKFSPTKDNLEKLQNGELDCNGYEKEIQRILSPELLTYMTSWDQIKHMLDSICSRDFRYKMLDDFGSGWVYNWHCMDHVGYVDNPRHKDIGYGNVFQFYRDYLNSDDINKCDEINWHFHPLSLRRRALDCASSYANSYDVLIQIIARRVVDYEWFPVVNRPGFHTERIDSHLFLEQWIPLDYANQCYSGLDDGQLDLTAGRFGDWRRAPATWRGYHPDIYDYQVPGACRRAIFRCLNVGTRFNLLKYEDVLEACRESVLHGSAILAFADHDWRDIGKDVEYVRGLLKQAKKEFPDVKICFSGAEVAAKTVMYQNIPSSDKLEPDLSLELSGNLLIVKLSNGIVFGEQPFLALKDCMGNYFHDNLDIQVPGKLWSYTFDDHTLPLSALSIIAVATAGRFGGYCVKKINL